MFRSKPSAKEQKNTGSIKMKTDNGTVPYVVVYVTVPSKQSGRKLAESIVKARLGASVNSVPDVETVGEWLTTIQTGSEELLIIKTRQSLLEALTEHVKANQEYHFFRALMADTLFCRVPEVVALPIIGGSAQHLEWIKSRTRD